MKCKHCDGAGKFTCKICSGEGFVNARHKCGNCFGYGIIPCSACNGKGRTSMFRRHSTG